MGTVGGVDVALQRLKVTIKLRFMKRNVSRLAMEVRRTQRRVIGNFLTSLLLLTLGLFALGTLFAVTFFLSGWVVAFFLAPVGYLAWVWLKKAEFKAVAYQLEQIYPELKGRLVAALELTKYKKGNENYSLELRDAAVAQVERLMSPLPQRRVVSIKRVFWGGLFAVGGVSLFLLFWGMRRVQVEVGLRNAFVPDRVAVAFEVEPGDTAVSVGEAVSLSCRVKPAGVFNRVKMELVDDDGDRRLMVLAGSFCSAKVVVRERMRYRFQVLSRSSKWFRMGLIEPLTLRRKVFHCNPPAYSGLPESDFTGDELVVLKGTKVFLEAEANLPIDNGRLVIAAETSLVTVDSAQPTRIRASFTARDDGELKVELTPSGSGTIQSVARLRLRILADESPFVKVFIPGRDVDLPMSMQVLLGVNSIDDYGLRELSLHYGKDSITQTVGLKTVSGKREDTTLYVWDLSSFGLLPGEVVRYYVEVTDNDIVSGPKASRSEMFAVRFPTMEEIYSAVVEKTQNTQEELLPLSAKQEEISSQLTRIGEELKKSRELSWEEKKRLEGLLEKQQQLLNQVAALKKEVAQKIDEMVKGMNWDEETMERLGQLQELLTRLLPPELQEALKELGKKLAEKSPDVRPMLEQVQLEQEKFKKSIEQALKMLKRIMEEERLEALARQARELEKAQEEVSQKLNKTAPEELAPKQAAINAALDSLSGEINKLSVEISESTVVESLKPLGKKIEQEGLAQTARELQNQLMRGERKQLKQKSEKLQSSFQELAERLERLSEELKRRRGEEVRQKLFARANALLTVSQWQESLEERGEKTTNPANLAGEEMGLVEATRLVAESLAALGAQTLVISPALGQELARAMNFMKRAADMLATGTGSSKGQMTQARMSLNRAVALVLDAAATQRGGMKSGFESLLEQLSQLTAEQMAINAGMSGIPIPIPASGLSAEQMEQLQGLLGQQRALREQLERLLQSMSGQRPGLTGRLDQLVEEMKAVERALAELQIDRKLIERQEGILSHLLDAQRSLRQQGFKEEREAETGKEYQIKRRPSFPADLGERNKFLREELLRALKQGYPREYERLIRTYFEKLLEER